jgi:hypothetical protein
MKTVELIEIEKLYMDCHVEMVKNQPIRTSLNTGSMNNRLNYERSQIVRKRPQTPSFLS